MGIHITGDAGRRPGPRPTHPFALLVGMMLDQQYPMEHAFRGPAKVLDRFGIARPGRDRGRRPRGVRGAVRRRRRRSTGSRARWPPGSRRWPRWSSRSTTAHAERLWTEADIGRGPAAPAAWRCPGFGKQKAQIFVALLAKQLGVRPDGLGGRPRATTPSEGYRSVADVVDAGVAAEGARLQEGEEGRGQGGRRPAP